MTALLDPNTAGKLARICGMFGSDHAGERAAAAEMADRLLKERGLTWFDIISPRWPTSPSGVRSGLLLRISTW